MGHSCVELRFEDGTTLDINVYRSGVEHTHTVRQKTKLDLLVYNASLEYAQLILSGEIQSFLRFPTEQ